VRFEKLIITGFKAFADPVELIFEDGLSGIVGPNGCGKSNLLEAIGWVMGETRPSAVRADTMDDVIFSGAASRPARGHAEVTLRVALGTPLPQSLGGGAGDVDISRRIDRTGTSTFRLNGRDVRRRDVQLLFADSSTGSRSTALVRQGQIADLINASPLARSAILENAAGISGLQQRRHEAELKLDSTERNLARVHDRVDQLQKGYNVLHRQAGQAKRYQKLADRMQELEMARACHIWRNAKESAVATRAELERQGTALAGAEARLAGTKRHREGSHEALEPLLKQQMVANDQLRQYQDDLVGHDDRASDAARAIHTLSAQLNQIDKDLARETELERDASKSIERLEVEQVTMKTSVGNFSADIAAANRLCSEAADALSTAERNHGEIHQAHIQFRTWQQQATEFQERHQQEVIRLQAEITALKSKIADARKTKTTKHFTLRGARKTLQTIARDAGRLVTEMDRAEEQRAQTIRVLEQAELQYSESVSLLRVSESEAENLTRILDGESTADLRHIRSIRVDQGYETALGAALGDALFIGQADSSDGHGWRILDGATAVRALPEGVESLKSHVEAPLWLDRRLGQIGVTDLATAKSLQARLQPGQRLVTRDGDVVRWDGLIASGETMQGKAAQRLTQTNQLTELMALIETCRVDTETKRKELEAIRTVRDQHSELCSNARQAWHETDRKLAEVRQTVAVGESDLETHERERAALETRLKRFQTDLMDARQKTGRDLTGAHSHAPQPVDIKKLEQSKTVADEARRAFNERQMACVALRRDQDDTSRRLQDMDEHIASWRLRNQQAQARIADLRQRRTQIDQERQEALQMPDRLKVQRAELVETLTRQETAARQLGDAVAVAETRYQDATENEQQERHRLQQIREDRVRVEMRDEAARSDLGSAIDAIRDAYNQTPEKLAETVQSFTKIPEDLRAIDDEITTLRHKRESIGAVNLRAVQDMQDLAEEMSSIVTEKEELEAAISKIRGSIANLNREGKTRLHEAFESVRKNFRILFTCLFEGGQADLERIQGDDPLCSGLEIRCHPPGKRQTTLGLMSGGEQTLTSIALIFAFFLTNPAPVCVLDEVDAQLDDANVLRLCNLLDDIVQRTGTRFMIVTHNAITMSRMDRLYGVTMQEKGISQLVYVDLGDAERLAA